MDNLILLLSSVTIICLSLVAIEVIVKAFFKLFKRDY
mgnify:CR=1 FL=1